MISVEGMLMEAAEECRISTDPSTYRCRQALTIAVLLFYRKVYASEREEGCGADSA